MSFFQQLKMWLVETLHLGKDALHVYVALAVFFATCLLFGWKARQWKPWLCVLAVALAGEAWDVRDSFVNGEPYRIPGSIKDIVNTVLVPTLLRLLARYSAIFERSPDAGPETAADPDADPEADLAVEPTAGR